MKVLPMHDELLEMKNLGKTSVQWLHASGIHSPDELRKLGSIAAYQAVKSRGFRASKVLLYAIEGALLNVPWNNLSETHKEALLAQLDHAQAH